MPRLFFGGYSTAQRVIHLAFKGREEDLVLQVWIGMHTRLVVRTCALRGCGVRRFHVNRGFAGGGDVFRASVLHDVLGLIDLFGRVAVHGEQDSAFLQTAS